MSCLNTFRHLHWHQHLQLSSLSSVSQSQGRAEAAACGTSPARTAIIAVGHQNTAFPALVRGHFLTILHLAELTAVEPHATIDVHPVGILVQ